MNDTVKKIVDLLFAKTVSNDETAALYEEVMNNCQEHYADLVARGLDEDDAIHEVVQSLKGMEEVISQYPTVDGKEDKTETGPADGAVKLDLPEMQEFSMDGVKRIKVETLSANITVLSSSDGGTHIHYDGCNHTIVTENIGDTLKISLKKIVSMNETEEKSRRTWRDVFPKHEDGSFSFNLKALGEMIQDTVSNVSIGEGGTLTVEIPAGSGYALEVNSRSGSLSVETAGLSELRMNSTSGDVNAQLPHGGMLREIFLNSTSGDITLTGDAEKLTANTMSGEVDVTGTFISAMMKTVSGDVELNGSARDLTANSVSGDVNLRTENGGEQDLTLNSVSGDLNVGLPAGVPVRTVINTASGDLNNCHPETPDAKIIVTAKTVSGDITIR